MRERVCRYGLKPPYQICIATSTTRDDDDAAGRTIEDIINAHTPETDRAKFEAKSYDEDDVGVERRVAKNYADSLLRKALATWQPDLLRIRR